MKLAINGEHVTYSLENERTLGEVVQGVQAWLAASGFLVSGLEADGRDLLGTPPAQWAPVDLAGVKELRVSADRTGDMRIEHWRTVYAWLSLLKDEIAPPRDAGGTAWDAGGTAWDAGGTARDAGGTPGTGGNPRPPGADDTLPELLAGLPQTLDGLAANPFLPTGTELEKRFRAIFDGARAQDVRAWPEERRSEAAGLLEEMKRRIQARLADAVHPQEALVRSARALKELQGKLSDVSVLLQTGRDRQAMEVVIGFTESAQVLLDVLPFLAPDVERARLITDLTPVLRQLLDAFNARDAILIGDLLEYEIAPRMERLTPLLLGTP